LIASLSLCSQNLEFNRQSSNWWQFSTVNIGTTNPRHLATISPSLVLNRTEPIEIVYLSAGPYRIGLQRFCIGLR